MTGGKKKEGISEEARTRILDAAQASFAAHGFSATTTKSIAQDAGVPDSLIFYYFPTKKALLASVLSERNILVELRAAVATLTTSDPHAALMKLGLCYVHTFKQHKELAGILLREFRSHPEVASQFHELREEHIAFIASYIEASLHTEQRESVKNVHAIARIFLYNIIVLGIIEDPSEPQHFVEEMVNVLLCSLVKTA